MTLKILKVLNKPKYVINQSKQSLKLRLKNHQNQGWDPTNLFKMSLIENKKISNQHGYSGPPIRA